MQSHTDSSKHKREQMPLPWGMGSMSWHGRVWWITYRDTEGKVHHENSRTEDAAEAQKLMAGRALPRALAMVETLERIINGDPYQRESEAERASAKPRAVRRDRRKTPANSGRRKGTEAPAGGQN
jgi:hypothetical protein